MIIGLTGRNAGGKGEVAQYLKARGFEYFSLSDVIRETLQRRGDVITREALIRTGNDLRQQYGRGYLAEEIQRRLQDDRNYVVDSIRNPGEVLVLRRNPRFVLLSVTAEPEVRFERMQRRGRENDPKTFQEFQHVEAREMSADGDAQQLQEVEKMADIAIENNASLEALHQRLREVVQGVALRQKRPDWDSYFMKIAQVTALRSNCIKRKVAAIIVKDRRVISSGYNGTPRGTRNCYEGGCPRCSGMAASGEALEECLCSHGEENAITQAAYHGVSVKGATLYTTFAPCLLCTKMIINSGIAEVVYNEEYPLNATAFGLLKEAGVLCRKLETTPIE
ncbi:MAG: AAA family ATPase [Acidobacteria bacterium]|nr:AAA family ATPase [Acidobacteriota bacterium]